MDSMSLFSEPRQGIYPETPLKDSTMAERDDNEVRERS